MGDVVASDTSEVGVSDEGAGDRVKYIGLRRPTPNTRSRKGRRSRKRLY